MGKESSLYRQAKGMCDRIREGRINDTEVTNRRLLWRPNKLSDQLLGHMCEGEVAFLLSAEYAP
jgi:hypothetical protein